MPPHTPPVDPLIAAASPLDVFDPILYFKDLAARGHEIMQHNGASQAMTQADVQNIAMNSGMTAS